MDENFLHKLYKNILIVPTVITNDCSQNGGRQLAADLRIELAWDGK